MRIGIVVAALLLGALGCGEVTANMPEAEAPVAKSEGPSERASAPDVQPIPPISTRATPAPMRCSGA